MKVFTQQSGIADISVYLNKGKWFVSILKKFPIREVKTIELGSDYEIGKEKAEKLLKELAAGAADGYEMKELIALCERY